MVPASKKDPELSPIGRPHNSSATRNPMRRAAIAPVSSQGELKQTDVIFRPYLFLFPLMTTTIDSQRFRILSGQFTLFATT